MQNSSILYILKTNGIDEKDIKVFEQKLKDKSFTLDKCDKLLEKMGYERIFILDNDDFEEEDSEYYLKQKENNHKNKYKKDDE